MIGGLNSFSRIRTVETSLRKIDNYVMLMYTNKITR